VKQRLKHIGACAAILALPFAAWLSLALSSRAQQAPSAPPQQPAQSGSQEKPAVISRVELVDVVFAVFNRRLKFVTDLQKENFKVFEDNQPQEIRFFSRETDLPLRVGMLLDTSNSIRDRIKFEQEAAIDFLYNVMRRHKDMAFLMTFDNEPEVIQDYTEDTGKLRDAILKQRAGGGTALYDAIYVACQRLLVNPPAATGSNPQVRRVLVVISDGDDNLSSRTRSEAIEMAQRAGVVIYAISTSTQWVSASEERDTSKRIERKYHKDEGDKVLDFITEETGGRSFFPYRIDDLAQSFLDIGDELRSQYSLAYVPANKTADGRFRKIRLDVDRKGLQVRARRGYYATRTGADVSSPSGAPTTRPPSKPPGQ
jgi:Ca-activated chloride channel family protein